MEIKIESSVPKQIQIIKLAPLWKSQEELDLVLQNQESKLGELMNYTVEPYFLTGIIRYLEKGETIQIRQQEFFVNDCQPWSGLIEEDTLIELETGFTYENFKQKQIVAD